MRVNKEVLPTTFFCTTCDCRREGYQTPDLFELNDEGNIHRITHLICNNCKNIYKLTDTFELYYKHTKEEKIDKEDLNGKQRFILHLN